MRPTKGPRIERFLETAIMLGCDEKSRSKRGKIDTKIISIGQALQNWLIRNKMDIYHPLFVDAVDHAFENESARKVKCEE